MVAFQPLHKGMGKEKSQSREMMTDRRLSENKGKTDYGFKTSGLSTTNRNLNCKAIVRITHEIN